MPKFITLEEADVLCKGSGQYKKLAFVNRQQVKSLMENAETNLKTANLVASSIDENDSRWMSVYIDYYDALHILAEAFLQFENHKIANHQCLFAFLCKNHPAFEFDWYFFEEIRFNRNGAHYYGTKITYEDWEKAKPKFNLYIPALRKEIEKKLSSYSI